MVDGSDDGLAAGIDVHMLDLNDLLSGAAEFCQGFDLGDEGALELGRRGCVRLLMPLARAD